jgi:hypothetical protein
MIESRTLFMSATLAIFSVTNAMASECKSLGGHPAMYRVVDDDGKVFFLDSPKHPACSATIERKIAADKRSRSIPRDPLGEERERWLPERDASGGTLADERGEASDNPAVTARSGDGATGEGRSTSRRISLPGIFGKGRKRR